MVNENLFHQYLRNCQKSIRLHSVYKVLSNDSDNSLLACFFAEIGLYKHVIFQFNGSAGKWLSDPCKPPTVQFSTEPTRLTNKPPFFAAHRNGSRTNCELILQQRRRSRTSNYLRRGFIPAVHLFERPTFLCRKH